MRQGIGLYGGNSVDDGEWVEGYLSRNIFGETFIIEVNENVCEISYEVDPKSVGEYSGDNPAAEEKIFENDVVKIIDDAGDEFIGVVERSECAFWVNNGKVMRKLWSDCNKVIKLGNIHRNDGCKMEGRNRGGGCQIE